MSRRSRNRNRFAKGRFRGDAPGAQVRPVNPNAGATNRTSGPPGWTQPHANQQRQLPMNTNSRAPAGPRNRRGGRADVSTPPWQQQSDSGRLPPDNRSPALRHDPDGSVHTGSSRDAAGNGGLPPYPGETPWHSVDSQYRSERPNQPPNSIRDVDIDYNWFCYSADTEVLTRRGWVLFKDLQSDDLVATRNVPTDRFEWQKPERRVRPWSGELIHFESRAVDILVTPEHRMLVSTLTRKMAAAAGTKNRNRGRRDVLVPAAAVEAGLNHHVGIPLTSKWSGTEIQEVLIEAQDPRAKSLRIEGTAYCAVLGLYLSEGSLRTLNGRATAVLIWQKRESPNWEAIREILVKAFGADGFRYTEQLGSRGDPGYFVIYSRALAEHLRQFGTSSATKFVPREILDATPAQIQAFWDAYVAGDGSRRAFKAGALRKFRGSFSDRIDTVSPRMADGLQELAAKMGYSASISMRSQSRSIGHSIETDGNTARVIKSVAPVIYRIGLRGATHASGLRCKRVSYHGMVCCATVPNGTLYVRRQGSKKAIWCGNTPFQPVWPFGPPFVTYPREWDYPVGINLEYISKRQELFSHLRLMSRSNGILRSVIERRKDQFIRIPWTFQLKDKPERKDKRIDELKEFFRKPDGKHTFQQWVYMLLDDKFVTDAATVYRGWRRRDGKPYVLEVIDGASIKPLIDDAGRIPDFPSPAYQQVVKGLPMVNFSEIELIYAPMRPSPALPIYGLSEVEMIMLEATQAIRRCLYQVEFWNSGTIPDVWANTPNDWTPKQVAMFQALHDSLYAGNMSQKSRVRFMPGDVQPTPIKGSAGELLKSEYDEWLARIICFTFAVSPQPFVREVNRSTAETSKEAAEEEGLHPLMVWWKDSFMDRLILEDFGYDDIEFVWTPKRDTDIAKQAQTLSIYVKAGIMTVNEARDQLGLPEVPEGDTLIVETSTGGIPLTQATEPSAPGGAQALLGAPAAGAAGASGTTGAGARGNSAEGRNRSRGRDNGSRTGAGASEGRAAGRRGAQIGKEDGKAPRERPQKAALVKKNSLTPTQLSSNDWKSY